MRIGWSDSNIPDSFHRMRGDRPKGRRSPLFPYGFTPHARGSTHFPIAVRASPMVYPACAGIDPVIGVVDEILERLPRMRGDRPEEAKTQIIQFWFTPHARGSTEELKMAEGNEEVYPACAGIDLKKTCSASFLTCLPRMRGDRPCSSLYIFQNARFTPHARGSTQTEDVLCATFVVYPACAGIDPPWTTSPRLCRRLPRMRGDRPSLVGALRQQLLFTPHARGSTVIPFSCIFEYTVYPACAGIDLSCF